LVEFFFPLQLARYAGSNNARNRPFFDMAQAMPKACRSVQAVAIEKFTNIG
jgi:hypothetical protein